MIEREELLAKITEAKTSWDHTFGGKLGIFFSNDELELLMAMLNPAATAASSPEAFTFANIRTASEIEQERLARKAAARAATAGSEPLSLQAVREDERLACWKIADKERTALKNADPTKAAWLVAFDIANAIKMRGTPHSRPEPAATPTPVEETRMTTDEDREYASELLADLTSDDLPRLEIAARWFRKARVEHSLRLSLVPRPMQAPGGSE